MEERTTPHYAVSLSWLEWCKWKNKSPKLPGGSSVLSVQTEIVKSIAITQVITTIKVIFCDCLRPLQINVRTADSTSVSPCFLIVLRDC